MKQQIVKTIVIIAAAFMPGSQQVCAQAWTKVDPKMTHMITDTTLVRAYVATLQPGEKSTSHTHPASFIYALTPGKFKVTYSDGKQENLEVKEGDGFYFDAERPHVTENAGTVTTKFLLVELKEHPYKAFVKK